jgi:hypothetical protein
MQRLVDEIAGHPPSALDANQGAFLLFMNLMLLWELLPSVSFRVAVMALRSDVRMPVTKALVAAASAALAALIATQAAQAQYRSRGAASVRTHRAPPEAYNSQRNPRYGFGPRVTVQPYDVVAGNRIIGHDPDAFIRGEILPHYHSGSPDR